MTTVECPSCATEFTPRRNNQKYCSTECRKNASRGSRSVEHQERSRLHYERASRLAEMLYTTPPAHRLGMMQHILSFVPMDAGLRNILTDQDLLSEAPQVNGRKNVAKAANAYTRKFFGVSIKAYIALVKEGRPVEGVEIAPEAAAAPKPMSEERHAKLTERKERKLPQEVEDVVSKLRGEAERAREADPELSDRLTLRADVKQVHAMTDEDFARADASVAEVQAKVEKLPAEQRRTETQEPYLLKKHLDANTAPTLKALWEKPTVSDEEFTWAETIVRGTFISVGKFGLIRELRKHGLPTEVAHVFYPHERPMKSAKGFPAGSRKVAAQTNIITLERTEA